MKKILHIVSSPRGERSMSNKLGNGIVEKIKEDFPGSTVTEVNLVKNYFPHLEEVHIASFFTPVEHFTDGNREAMKHSDQAIAQIKDADVLVIDAPMYNFGIPSALKTWLDHVVRVNVTFKIGEQGPEGLVQGKKLYIALAAGAIYSSGPMENYDFVTPYLKLIFGFIGITDVTVFRIEGTNVPVVQDTAVEKGLESVLKA